MVKGKLAQPSKNLKILWTINTSGWQNFLNYFLALICYFQSFIIIKNSFTVVDNSAMLPLCWNNSFYYILIYQVCYHGLISGLLSWSNPDGPTAFLFSILLIDSMSLSIKQCTPVTASASIPCKLYLEASRYFSLLCFHVITLFRDYCSYAMFSYVQLGNMPIHSSYLWRKHISTHLSPHCSLWTPWKQSWNQFW